MRDEHPNGSEDLKSRENASSNMEYGSCSERERTDEHKVRPERSGTGWGHGGEQNVKLIAANDYGVESMCYLQVSLGNDMCHLQGLMYLPSLLVYWRKGFLAHIRPSTRSRGPLAVVNISIHVEDLGRLRIAFNIYISCWKRWRV